MRGAISDAMAEIRAAGAAATPLGHSGVPADIASGVVFLASDESRFITGTELVIDGGVTAARSRACSERSHAENRRPRCPPRRHRACRLPRHTEERRGAGDDPRHRA
ncbi:MAG: SDR family oxidoreductase [Rhizomicrobium sp.]